MSSKVFRARVIKEGRAKGLALVSSAPISFFGGVDLDSGRIREPGHPLHGQSLAGRILVFPTGKGSTVGSYALYRLAKAGLAPAALVMERCEPIVATGAILSGIPCVDELDLSPFHDGDLVEVAGETVSLSGWGDEPSASQPGEEPSPASGVRGAP